PPIHVAPPEAAQFDFLVGHWEVEARPRATGLAQRIHGAPRILGTWKAWRALDGFGIEDELRLLDGSGNPISLSYAIRAFDPTARKWTQTTLDVYRGRFTPAEGEWRNGEMHVTSRGTDPEGQAYVARTRFFDITPTGFRFQQDRSTDNGRTWTDAVLRMEVKRIAATAPR
ncbi:MAG TPA: hypothetical protein VD793_11450, partial [Gemmatimonadales bacterium]|nr:hypothetical protein [Gemmatimonadales bacterium]